MPDLAKLKGCGSCGGRVAGRDPASLARLAGAYVDPADGLPGADFKLLTPLKRSAEYRAIRKRVAELKPVDAWQLEGYHYFVFALKGAGEGAGEGGGAAAPMALFAMNGEPGPAYALVLTPDPAAGTATAEDLRHPGTSFTVEL